MNAELLEFVENLTAWHTRKISHLRDIQDNVKEGTALRVGSDVEDVATMTKREAAFFGAGMEAALVELETLPFTVTRNDDQDEEGGEDD